MCNHIRYHSCKAADCNLYKNSPWVCVARYYEDYPELSQFDANRLLKYGTLRDHPNSCPWSRNGNITGLGPDGQSMCQVHRIVIERQAASIKPICQCDVWTTGCVCGTFKKEQDSS